MTQPDGALAPPGANGFPIGSHACHTCNHPARVLIEELMRAGCSLEEIRRRILAMGMWCATHQAMSRHKRMHLLPVRRLERLRAAQAAVMAGQQR
jgi:hypothetical protein